MTNTPHRGALAWVVLLLTSTAVHAASSEITQPYEGVRLIHSQSMLPRQVDYQVVEIDLEAAGLSFFVTPSNGALPGDVTPQTTRAFASQWGAQLAVNASFFASAGSGQYHVQGLSVSNGDAYSEFETNRLHALNISAGNVATIIRAISDSGTAHQPRSTLYNAVGGDARIVTDGANTANAANTTLAPRTAAGVTIDQKLLLLTVDGRNPGHSEGMTVSEVADILIRHGARQGINLDGGGSTTLVVDDPRTAASDPQVVNIPSDLTPDGMRGKERAVANNLAVFAAPQSEPLGSTYVFADFEGGDAGPFNASIAFSGSNRGIDLELSSAELIEGEAHEGGWSQRLSIIDDPNLDGADHHPGGAWFARHVAGFGAPANNDTRPADGVVGFWAKTSNQDLRISLVLDDASLTTGERGVAQDMLSDGEWHRYEWNLDDTNQWEGWVNGDGTVNDTFTLDSIQVFGPAITASNPDAAIYIDDVFHDLPAVIEPALPGDYNRNGTVDAADYTVWRDTFGASIATFTGADGDGDGTIDAGDYDIWKSNFGMTGATGSASAASVPEPASLLLVVLGSLLTAIRSSRHVRRRDGPRTC